MVHTNGKTTTRTLKNRIHRAARYTVALTIAKSGEARRLTISTRVIRLAPGSNALMTWEVLKRRTLVAHHSVSLTGSKLHRGLVGRTFPFRAAGSAGYTLRGTVALLSPAPTGMYMSQQVARLQRFNG